VLQNPKSQRNKEHNAQNLNPILTCLAFSGFASFAIGFFGIGTLPRRYETIDIEYFEKAIKLVCHKFKDEVDSEAVALMGISKGKTKPIHLTLNI
jgi:hypothetical protein